MSFFDVAQNATAEVNRLQAQVIDLAARLTTSEQERDRLREFLSIADSRAGTEHTNRVLAEARVEAAEQALREIAETAWDFSTPQKVKDIARAALACPPQQRGEK